MRLRRVPFLLKRQRGADNELTLDLSETSLDHAEELRPQPKKNEAEQIRCVQKRGRQNHTVAELLLGIGVVPTSSAGPPPSWLPRKAKGLALRNEEQDQRRTPRDD